MVGKVNVATTLNKNITEIDLAMSSSPARMTGAAAIADPPQMAEPTPTRAEVFLGTLSSLCIAYATANATDMVTTIMGRDNAPISAINAKFNPKPRKTTAAYRTVFEQNAVPSRVASRLFMKEPKSMPRSIPKTGPPTTGIAEPRNQHGIAIAMHKATPGTRPFAFFLEDP